MANSIVSTPYHYFGAFNKGRPVFNADIYVGEPDLDPEDISSNQKQVTLRQEDGTEVEVGQPLNTGSGGYITYNNSVATALVDGAYSIIVFDSQGNQIYYSSNVTDGVPITVESLATQNFIVYNYDTLNDAVISTTLVDGQALNIKERTTGNGGGAMWDVVLSSTVTEDTYSIVQATGVATLSLVLRLDGIANPKMFGATGDGSTDDSLPCQAALDSDVDEVDFTGGSFLITLQGVIERPSSFNINYGLQLTDSKKIIGSGSIVTASSTICALLCNGADDISIEGITIDGQYEFPTNGQGVIFVNCKNTSLTGCLIKNIYAPWKYEENEAGEICDTGIVSNNRFVNIGQSGTKPGGVNNIVVSDNVYRDIFQTAISIEAENSTATGTSGATVTGNILSGFDGTNTTDNLDGRIQGIVVSENFNKAVVSNNVLTGDLDGTHTGISSGILISSSPAQDDTPVTEVIVTGNVIADWDYDIYVVTDNVTLSHLMIEGNTIVSPKSFGIIIARLDSGSTGSIENISVLGNYGDLDASTGTPTGISADTATTILQKATISGNTMNGFDVGYNIGGLSNIALVNNVATDCTSSFDVDSVAVVQGNSSVNSTNAAFTIRNTENVVGNVVDVAGASAMTIFAGSGAKIHSNVISGVTGAGITVNTATNAVVTNNSISNTSGSTIRIEASSTGCTVANNVLDGAVSSGAVLVVPVADTSGNLVY